MTSRWLLAAALGIALSFVAPALGGEPYLEFIKGLRDREYHDLALQYIDELEQRPGVPAEIREVLSYEKAVTLLEGARSVRSPEAQGKQLDQARAALEQFLKASPNHPHAAQANSELAQVFVGKGKVEVLQSRSPGNAGQKAEFQRKARAYFAEARQVFQAAHDRFKAEYEKFDKFIPRTDKARYEARELAYVNWIQTQLNLAVLNYEEAQTYDKGSEENRSRLTDASNDFEQIHARHRSLVAGLYARMWQGKCFEEQDDITKAIGIYDELLGHGGDKPTGALKTLQDRVLLFKLICLNHDKRKDYQVVVQTAGEWVKEHRSSLSTRNGLGIQWELVRAEELLARKEGLSETERNRLMQHALTTARSINRYPGEYKEGSTAMIQRLMVALDREPGAPKDFATAFGIGRNLIDDIRNRNKAIAESSGGERDRLAAELQPVLKEAVRILRIALALASSKDDDKDVNRARYFLSYAYYSLREYSYESAILGEFVARKYVDRQPDAALESAYLAQAAHIQAYNRSSEKDRSADVGRIISICNFITDHWPDSDKAQDARMNLGAFFSQLRQPAEAARWYLQVPESAPQHLEAQLAAGSAFWVNYLEEAVRPEADRKPAPQLEELVKQARGILQNAITRFESQLPREIGQVEPARLARLTEAKLTYGQILNGSGDYKGALAQLAEGPLSVVAAVAPPGGNEQERPPKPNIRSREFASLAHQQILRAHVGVQDLDLARAEMKELEKIEGTAGGGAALTRIFLDLGKELEKEVKRLQEARDPRLGDVLKSFEKFLDDMSSRKEGQDYHSRMWVSETYRALGEGLEAGDSTTADSYFARAIVALDAILKEEAKQPGYAPREALTGVRLRKVMCLRRQKAFDEGIQLAADILKEHPRALDAQFEAARLYQDWAARGGPSQRDKWGLAIDGDQRLKKKEKLVWGWSGIAQRLDASLTNATSSHSEHKQQYLEARYNVAWCRFQEALSHPAGNERNKLLELAEGDVIITSRLSPDLGGGESWEKFNGLYRSIQKVMVDTGLQKGAIVDLDKRAPRPPRESSAAKGTAAKKQKPAAKNAVKAKRDSPAATSHSSSGSSLTWVVMGLVVVAGGGAAVWLAFFRKQKRPIYEIGFVTREEAVGPNESLTARRS
jgi:cellulose synthase operon protein C